MGRVLADMNTESPKETFDRGRKKNNDSRLIHDLDYHAKMYKAFLVVDGILRLLSHPQGVLNHFWTSKILGLGSSVKLRIIFGISTMKLCYHLKTCFYPHDSCCSFINSDVCFLFFLSL